MKGLPIEPNCRAMIVAPFHPNSRGRVVVVRSRIEKVNEYVPAHADDGALVQCWITQRAWWVEGNVATSHHVFSKHQYPIHESSLRRIDGPPDIEESTLNLSEVNVPAGVLML